MFSGLIPAMITPFDEGGEVDLRATEAVVEHFVGAGVDGISALGSTGEFSHLTLDERKSFAEAVVEIVNGKTSLLIGVGAPGTREAIELARHAEEIGADGVPSSRPSTGRWAKRHSFGTLPPCPKLSRCRLLSTTSLC